MKWNLKVELKSLKVVDKLEKAIDDTYSKQGIEYKKRLMVQGIDISLCSTKEFKERPYGLFYLL